MDTTRQISHLVVLLFATSAVVAYTTGGDSSAYGCSLCGDLSNNYNYGGGLYDTSYGTPYSSGSTSGGSTSYSGGSSGGGSSYGGSGGSSYGGSGGSSYGGGGGSSYGGMPSYATYNYNTEYKPTTYNYALDPCQCYGHGDPRYTTCDGRRMAIKGDCKYTLAKPCRFQSGQEQPYFEIRVKQTECFYNGFCIKYIEIEILGKLIRLMNDGKVMVKNAGVAYNPAYQQQWNEVALPYQVTSNEHVVTVKKAVDDTLILEVDFGLFVYFGPGVHNKLFRWVEVIIPACYAYHICGICGNYNGKPGDDMTTANGVIVDYMYDQSQASTFYSDSWIVPDFEMSMDDKCYGKCISEICGCIDDNERRHDIGDRWYNEDCSAIYTCVQDKLGRVYKKVKNARCLYPNQCKKVNGVTACYSDGPCLQIGTPCCGV